MLARLRQRADRATRHGVGGTGAFPWWPAAAAAGVLVAACVVVTAVDAAHPVASPTAAQVPPAAAAARAGSDVAAPPSVVTVAPRAGVDVGDASMAGQTPAPVKAPGEGTPAHETGAAGGADPAAARAAAAAAAAGGMSNPKSAPMGAAAAGAAGASSHGVGAGGSAASQSGVAFPLTPDGLLPQAAQSAPPGGVLTGVAQPALGSAGPVRAEVTNAQVYALIQTEFPASEWARANRVSQCESGQRNVVSKPNSNGSIDAGVFQLNDGGTLQQLLVEDGYPRTRVDLALDAAWNVRAAARLWSQRGWQPWTCAAKLGYL